MRVCQCARSLLLVIWITKTRNLAGIEAAPIGGHPHNFLEK